MNELYHNTGYEAVLVPTLFQPPIMLSNIFRLACQLKRKGFTTGPDRRMGGWHLKLLDAGVTACQVAAQGGATLAPPRVTLR